MSIIDLKRALEDSPHVSNVVLAVGGDRVRFTTVAFHEKDRDGESLPTPVREAITRCGADVRPKDFHSKTWVAEF